MNFWINEDGFKKYKDQFNNAALIKNTIYEDHDIREKIIDSSILIIGGGPTTNECEWDHHGYDCILSCNHFFLNERLRDVKVDIATISPEMNPYSEPFINYVKSNKTIFVFDNEWWDHQKKRKNIIYNNTGIKFSNIRSRFYTKLGAGARLLLFAGELGAQKISFVGIDGYPPGVTAGMDSKHSFEIGKKVQTPYGYDVFDQQYKQLSEYLKTLNIEFVNLGKGHKYNILTKYL